MKRRRDESAGLAVALAAAAPCAGEGAYERVVRELLCADPSTNDDDDDDRVGDDDDRYDDRYDDDDDAFARTSYAFEFASLFDGRHLAARTVAALRALIESSDRFGAPDESSDQSDALIESSDQSGAATSMRTTDVSPRIIGRAVASVGACASGLDADAVLAEVVPILSAVIDRARGANDDATAVNIIRREALRGLCACAESHADDDSVVDAAHDALNRRVNESFADGPGPGGATDRETVEAVAEMLGRAGMKGFGRHRARAAATLARVASREAAAAAAAGAAAGARGVWGAEAAAAGTSRTSAPRCSRRSARCSPGATTATTGALCSKRSRPRCVACWTRATPCSTRATARWRRRCSATGTGASRRRPVRHCPVRHCPVSHCPVRHR